jgi:hypothetical protein
MSQKSERSGSMCIKAIYHPAMVSDLPISTEEPTYRAASPGAIIADQFACVSQLPQE